MNSKSKKCYNGLGQYKQNGFRKYFASFLRLQKIERYCASTATLETLDYPHMKEPASLKPEVSDFCLQLLDFDGYRNREEGNVFWLGGPLVEIGIIFSANICFPFLVRSQALLNV